MSHYDQGKDLSIINANLERSGINFKGKTVLITGGAGFLGSWMCDVLVGQGASVICLDNLSSGSLKNVEHLEGRDKFRFILHDIAEPIYFGVNHPNFISIPDVPVGSIDIVMHMASRASPFEFSKFPIAILKSNTMGTFNALGIAMAHGATLFYSSTSEVYGNPPPEHVPTPETYWGHVNSVGPRSCYDESKRAGEAFIMAYKLQYGITIKISRIFNTYGPRIRSGREFGRVVPNFIHQALNDEPITVFGDGSQTRSFTYVTDEIEGLLRDVWIPEAHSEVINVGNDQECTVKELAETIVELTGSNSKIVYEKLPIDDPVRRCPVLDKAKRILDWEPRTDLKTGLEKTIAWFRDCLR
ncbi:MAG: NAD-dependent epimerase/dehydratase family protein [Promethearchaeota archaeon]